MKRKICVVIGSRANYSSIKSVMQAIEKHSRLQLQVVVCASALLDRFGSVVDLIKKDGFRIDDKVQMIVEGETPVTMAKSTALGLLELPSVFERLKPNFVVSVGDRFETMATAVAATYMNIPLVHTMGGEVSGTIDESIRHAVTKLAHIHFPANQHARARIIRLGENPKYVFAVGCPRMDLVKEVMANGDRRVDQKWVEKEGVGGIVNMKKPFLMVSQHPVTTEYGQGEKQINETLKALDQIKMPAMMLWPNVDAGSEDISRGMRKFRERYHRPYIRYFKNFPAETYIRLMSQSACMVGNSSAAIREGAFLGVPAVNVGTRQTGRERGRNVIDVSYDAHAIQNAVKKQLRHGRYSMSKLYGDGKAGERVANILAKITIQIQKRITY